MTSKGIGSRRVVGVDHIADVDEAVAGAALDRRGDRAILEVQLCRFQSRQAGGHASRRHGHGVLGLIELLLGDGPGGQQLLDACELGFGEIENGLVLGKVAAGQIELRLVGTRVDREEQIALLDVGPVGEMDLGDLPGDLRLDRHHFACHALANLIDIDGHVALLGREDRDGRWRSLEIGHGLASAAAWSEYQASDCDQASGRCGGIQEQVPGPPSQLGGRFGEPIVIVEPQFRKSISLIILCALADGDGGQGGVIGKGL